MKIQDSSELRVRDILILTSYIENDLSEDYQHD